MKKFLLLFFLCLFATPCYANAGIPVFALLPVIIQSLPFGFLFFYIGDFNNLIFKEWLAAGISLCFLFLWIVVLIEYKYLFEHLPKIDRRVLKKEVWRGNIITTLIGILFWIPACRAKSSVGYLVLGPINLVFDYVSENVIWFFWLPVLLIYVCFILSYKIEARFIQKIKGDYTEEEVSLAVRKANRWSYWALVLCAPFWPIAFVVLLYQIRDCNNLEKEIERLEKEEKNSTST